ncbi:MAG: D-aminoacylase [Bryobacterales bacterium]|nr:D-aminoacylase [Bryobacteraceae bacterium]MDW8129696.1 D-aminoacylase [Bryobacterales bacterium]
MRWLALLLAFGLAPAADYDLLIRNARVVDGTGNPWFRADVAVRDGRVAAVGRLDRATALRVVEAAGRVLAPGFIDIHTHIEGGIEKVPGADNYVMDGVTTVVTGNCGGSWQDLADAFARLIKNGIGVNVASFIGHNTVRRQVMGASNRAATPEELARMQELVEKGMRDGALGFSTGLIYIPGVYAPEDEILALARVAARYGGIYASHIRDEGARAAEAIEEAVRVGREAGLPVQIAHFKIDNRRLWGASTRTLALIEQARRQGVDVTVDQYPYDRSSTGITILLPEWALADGEDRIKQRLADPATRKRIAREMERRLKSLGHKNYSYAMVASCEHDRSLEGRTITEIARNRPGRGLRREIETILEIVERGGAQMVYHSMSEEDVVRILRHPFTAVASDGGVREFGVGVPHPRSYGTRARVLAEYVRRRGLLSLEEAVRKMTSLPARCVRLRDRGLVREGFAADLVLFDPDRVQDKATFRQPHQYSEGFDLVLVNGQAVVENGKLTGARPGRILRRQ